MERARKKCTSQLKVVPEDKRTCNILQIFVTADCDGTPCEDNGNANERVVLQRLEVLCIVLHKLSTQWACFEITNVFCDVITRHKHRLYVRHKHACNVAICEGW
jgi:hypothetical protein